MNEDIATTLTAAPQPIRLHLNGAWVRHDVGAPVQLEAGDVAIVRGPEPYTVADDGSTDRKALAADEPLPDRT